MLTASKSLAARLLRGVARRLDSAPQGKRTLTPFQQSLEVLKSLSFEPQHIVDIGANHGNWTNLALEKFPNAYYTMVEPNPQLRPYFVDLLKKNSKITLHQVGIGAVDAQMVFNVHPDDTSSSFAFSADEATNMGCKQIQVPVRSLDSLLSEVQLPSPNLIKIDAEGLDLEVLRGASKTISTCDVVYIECSVTCKSMPNDMITVLQAMRDLGFELFDISDAVRTPTHRCLWLMEMLFVKADGELSKQASVYR